MSYDVERKATLAALALGAVALTGCELVEGVFKAGLWAGIVAVVLLAALVAGAVAFARRKLHQLHER